MRGLECDCWKVTLHNNQQGVTAGGRAVKLFRWLLEKTRWSLFAALEHEIQLSDYKLLTLGRFLPWLWLGARFCKINITLLSICTTKSRLTLTVKRVLPAHTAKISKLKHLIWQLTKCNAFEKGNDSHKFWFKWLNLVWNTKEKKKNR